MGARSLNRADEVTVGLDHRPDVSCKHVVVSQFYCNGGDSGSDVGIAGAQTRCSGGDRHRVLPCQPHR